MIALLSLPLRGGQVMAQVTDSPDASATDKTPGFSVRKEQRPVVDAFEDFDRYRDKKAWEKAFTALAKIEEKPGRLVPDKDGFFIPTELKVRAELLSLPPDGREAYRLFNDAKAKQLLKDLSPAEASAADGSPPNGSTVDEIAGLTKIVNRYFITAVGDRAADRLGDALFESGNFAGAQRCWQMIVDSYPDSSLSTALLQTKRAIALARAGEWARFETIRSLLHDRFAGQTARIGGQDVNAVAFVDSLHAPSNASSTAPSTPPAQPARGDSIQQQPSTFAVRLPDAAASILPKTDNPAWQLPFMDDSACAQLTAALSVNGWQAMGSQFTEAVPASVVDSRRVYINWLGICFAIDLRTGKMLWRSDSFGDMPQKMAQSMMQGTSIDPAMYSATLVGSDRVLFTRRNQDNQNFNEIPMNRLMCVNGVDGHAVWKSESGSLSGWGFVGQPMVAGDVFFILAHAQTSPDLSLLCIGSAGGDLRWKTDLGSPATSVNWRGQPSVPTPALLRVGDKVEVLTNNGVVLQVDSESHQVDWAFSYPTYVASQQQFFYGYAQPTPTIAPGALLAAGSTLYFKEYNSNLLFALDVSEPSVKWKRRIDSEAGLASYDGRNIFLTGTEFECIDAGTLAMQWDAKTSISTGTIQPLIDGDWMYLFGSRGIERVRLSTGESGPRFRGYDHESGGGILWKTSDRLVTVSSRAITAYALGTEAGHATNQRGQP
jgi:outer membrane protein assembly factor BamB